MHRDTIFALASGRPPAAIAIIRISGPAAHAAGALIAGLLPDERSAAVRELRSPATGDLLDEALVLRFDGPASATGEDVVELHCHGGRAVVEAVLETVGSVEGVRSAVPGEFTRRAFENGRIDLTEAEGLADLIEAETESQRKAALAVAEGGLSKQIELWRQRLVNLSAQAERAIDYDEDHHGDADGTLQRECAALAGELRNWLARPRMERLKDGIRVVLAGPPNAGKSSLLNALAGSERAIVTDIPGTTRDHVEVPMALAGLPVVLTDTAGLRDASEPVERIGVERARSLVDRADILVWLGDPDSAPAHPQAVLTWPKSDLARREVAPSGTLAVSARSGEGLSQLLEEVARRSRALLPGEDAIVLNRRQAGHLDDAATSLGAAETTSDPVLLAESLRSARTAFDRLTGRAGFEDVLDALFSRFCLGK